MSTQRTARKSAVLSVEALEGRDLMSAAVPVQIIDTLRHAASVSGPAGKVSVQDFHFDNLRVPQPAAKNIYVGNLLTPQTYAPARIVFPIVFDAALTPPRPGLLLPD
jgi:hypothetical protein